MTTELWRLGASELADGIRARQFSSREVVQAHLDRIEAVNGKVNAVTVVLGDTALAAADAADRAVASGQALGPLHGVPITVKENIDLLGSATTYGIVALKGLMPPADNPFIAQVKAAGAIPIGRTNLPEFGMDWHTDNALHGPTLNPWDATRTPGGSSGGEAAALATGMTPLGFGNDYGGSLRWPSQCCGTAAIKPTLGRVPSFYSTANTEVSFITQLMAVNGPMARHARDLRLALSVMCGSDARCTWWVPAPLAVERDPLRPRRAALTINPMGGRVDPDVEAGLRTAAQALTAAGYNVEEVNVPDVAETRRLQHYLLTTDYLTGLFKDIKHLLRPRLLQGIEAFLASMPAPDLAGFVDALANRSTHLRRWNQLFSQFDVVLGPVSTQPPFKVESYYSGELEALQLEADLALTVTCNVLGLPAAVVPVGVAHGLPQAVQIIGARYAEWTCLDAAEAIEAALGTVTPIDPFPVS